MNKIAKILPVALMFNISVAEVQARTHPPVKPKSTDIQSPLRNSGLIDGVIAMMVENVIIVSNYNSGKRNVSFEECSNASEQVRNAIFRVGLVLYARQQKRPVTLDVDEKVFARRVAASQILVEEFHHDHVCTAKPEHSGLMPNDMKQAATFPKPLIK